MKSTFALLGVLAVLSLGCGSGAPNDFMAQRMDTGEAGPGAVAKKNAAPEPAGEEMPRKIIYTARVDLNVGDFDTAEEQLKQLAKDCKGYVASSNIFGSAGSLRNGSWTVRVPIEQFDVLLLVALAPWLALFAIAGIPGVLFLRRQMRRPARSAPATTAVTTPSPS